MLLFYQDNTASGLLKSATFYAPLNDAGAGAVNLTLANGTGVATYTRASVAWTKLASGLWAQVASGTARSTYLGMNTAVGGYGGYLAEGAGIQLVTPTASINGMDDASWVKVNTTAVKNATGIDGVANSASTVTATANNGTILQTLVAAASTRTYSAFIRRKTGTGTVELVQGVTTLNITAQLNSVTYTCVALTASELNAAFGLRFGTSGDAVEVHFNQFEAGAFSTSPMASAGAARVADALTYVFAGNASATVGSAYAELSYFGDSPTAAQRTAVGFAAASDGPLYITNTGVNTSILIFDGTNFAQKAGLTSMSTAVRKRASAWGAAGLLITGDGATVATGTFDGNMGSTAIGIGCGTSGANQWYGTAKNVRIFATQFSAAQLQAITS